jgi:alkanesulfonate monooxygenase SsuD/methylene tetrahydromethanopterin reductase-like flavin-dependent oxidoreductase (luciferase family)
MSARDTLTTTATATAGTGHPAIGVFLPTMSRRDSAPGDVVAAARHAEELGFESAWAVDQLVAGAGVPLIESIVALSAAAGATTRLRLGLGVLILPLRPVAWVAKQVASLQVVSGNRLVLGIGVGGDRHAGSWDAVGVPRRERGARTDAALEVLAELVAGRPARVADQPGSPVLQLLPGAGVPPILVGGLAPAALERTARVGDGWFALPLDPGAVAEQVARIRTRAAELGRPAPAVTASLMIALDGDPSRPPAEEVARQLADPDGMFAMPAEAIPGTVVNDPDDLRDRVAAWAELGAERVVFTVAAGDWFRQTELLAAAVGVVPAAVPV